MALSLDAAAEVFREAMRDTVKRYSLWYLIQGDTVGEVVGEGSGGHQADKA